VAGFEHARCGVVWVDAHADFNTPDSTASGFFAGMSLAILTGHCYRHYWAQIGESIPIDERAVLLVGACDLSPTAEQDRLAYHRSAGRVHEPLKPCEVPEPFSVPGGTLVNQGVDQFSSSRCASRGKVYQKYQATFPEGKQCYKVLQTVIEKEGKRPLVAYWAGGSVSARRTYSLRSSSEKNWADAGNLRQELAEWCQAEGGSYLEVVERTPGTRGFALQPRRWVVERTYGWLSRNRRLSKDYERKVQTSETLIQVAMVRLLLARVGRKS